ncbi:MAG: hypothetical protein M3Z09_04715, partial [Acidobacteriota bacterium]|nr:hypothetical protein [Acidobacteriota bacterium]
MLLVCLWLPALLQAASERWIASSTGSLGVVSNAGSRSALEALGQFEQLRYALGELIGKPDLVYRPPLRLLLLKRNSSPETIVHGRARLILPLEADQPIPSRAFADAAALLLANGTARIPESFREGVAAFLSTVEIRGAHVVWGAPPAPALRTLSWARVDILATRPEYYGKLKVLLFNLQKGVAEDAAFTNSIGKSPAEFTAEAGRYLKAGIFNTADAPSRTLNVQRDLKVVTLTDQDGRLAIADLLDSRSESAYRALIDSKSHLAEAYEGLGLLAARNNDTAGALENFRRAVELESNDASLWVSVARTETDRVRAGEAIARALELDPENAEAHYLQGLRTNDPAQFSLAVTFAPQNSTYWDALATAYLDHDQFAEAAKAWRAAEQNAPTDAIRARMRNAWMSMEAKRLDHEESERRRMAEEKRLAIERVKNKAISELHASEARINGVAANGGPVPVPWDEVMPVHLEGALSRVECSGPRTIITITEHGVPVKLLVK